MTVASRPKPSLREFYPEDKRFITGFTALDVSVLTDLELAISRKENILDCTTSVSVSVICASDICLMNRY